MYKQITIKTLDQQGNSKANIARELGCHRNTVYNVLHRDGTVNQQTRSKPSVFLPHKDTIKRWLEEDKLTKKRIHEKLQEEYAIADSYDALRRFMKKHLPKEPKAYGVQEHLPGEEIEMDYGDIWLFIEEEGRKVKFQGMGFILPYSGMRYCILCDNQKMETFLTGFESAFVYYGGIPKRVKTDNLKNAVLKNTRHELVFNQNFLEFAYHYRFVINPCTPYSPQQKGAVEGTVKYVQRSFAAGRSFTTRQEARQALTAWLDTANAKVHGTYKEGINDRFAREKPLLQPIPSEPFALLDSVERVVGMNCHVSFRNNYYSVPMAYVAKTVTVRFSDTLVRIVYQGEEIALHHRDSGVGHFVTVRGHLPSHKVYSESEFQRKHEATMQAMGDNAHDYFKLLLDRQPGHWRQTIRSLYSLADEFGRETMDKALGRALIYGATDSRTIRHILEHKLYEIEEQPAPVFSSANSREMSYYEL